MSSASTTPQLDEARQMYERLVERGECVPRQDVIVRVIEAGRTLRDHDMLEEAAFCTKLARDTACGSFPGLQIAARAKIAHARSLEVLESYRGAVDAYCDVIRTMAPQVWSTDVRFRASTRLMAVGKKTADTGLLREATSSATELFPYAYRTDYVAEFFQRQADAALIEGDPELARRLLDHATALRVTDPRYAVSPQFQLAALTARTEGESAGRQVLNTAETAAQKLGMLRSIRTGRKQFDRALER